jgi:hypothetical protein
MRYHHGYGCYGHGGGHWGCGPEPAWGSGLGYGCGWWDSPYDEPRPSARRGRIGGAVPRRSTAAQLEAYLATLRDEMRAVEQDLSDLGSEEMGAAADNARG